jgi:predicted unusual protein kinase regulating ubiquinone biosynthesis (AarF/ABC1/UbiB family)
VYDAAPVGAPHSFCGRMIVSRPGKLVIFDGSYKPQTCTRTRRHIDDSDHFQLVSYNRGGFAGSRADVPFRSGPTGSRFAISVARTHVQRNSFVPGHPVEELADAPSETRNKVATRLLDLALRELLQWGLVQTDAHFGNYRYDPQSERIGLLDFGATRRHGARCMAGLRRLIRAAVHGDRAAIEDQAIELGYLRPDEAASCRDAMLDMVATVAEPACSSEPFAFAASDLSQRVAAQATALRLRQRYWHLPPLDILFLHRKLAGTYLLCTRLRARVDVAALVDPYLL